MKKEKGQVCNHLNNPNFITYFKVCQQKNVFFLKKNVFVEKTMSVNQLLPITPQHNQYNIGEWKSQYLLFATERNLYITQKLIGKFVKHPIL